jgi:hypothetical protein
MQKRIVINKGKKYIVNAPGGDDGIGAGCPSGIAWLQDDLDAWQSVQLTGLSGSLVTPLAFSITPISTNSVGMNANDFGFQIIMANDNLNYEVSVDSAGPTLVIDQTPSDYASSKPFLFLQSITDGAYYYVSALNTAGTITLVINDNTRIAGSLVSPLN